MAVHVLQTLTRQGGGTRGRADEETAGHLVGGGPDRVTGALESEHRVEDVQRDHDLAVGGVGGAGGDELGDRTCLVDALVHDVAVRGLLVGEHEVGVHRRVVLAVRVVDLQRREPGVHTEGTGLVRDDRHEPLLDLRVLHELLERAHQGHGRGDLLLARALEDRCHDVRVRDAQRGVLHAALRQRTAQRLPALQHVLDLGGVRTRVVVRRGLRIRLEHLVGDRDLLLVAEALEVVEGQLLHLVGRIASLEVVAQTVALDGVGQDDGRLVLRLHGALVGGVDLAVVVAAAAQGEDLLVGHVLDELRGLRVPVEEELADVGAVLALEGLVVTVGGGVHDVDEVPVLVLLQQPVPLAGPDDLDDIPTGATEEALQLLDDLRVTADRAVEALQVAVHHESQVVEVVHRGLLDEPTGLRLIHLTVTEERPDVLLGGVLDPPVAEVLVEPCLVDRVHRAQAHRHGRELPELRHVVRVRVGGHPVLRLGLLLTEAVHVLLGEASLEEGAGVHAGGGVALEEDVVAAARVVLAAEEVVEADLVECGGGGVGGDVATDTDAGTLGAVHHDRGIPPHPAAVALLHRLITRELRLHRGGDGVDVVGRQQRRQRHPLGGRAFQHPQHQVAGPVRAGVGEQTVEGVHPLLGLIGVGVLEVGRDTVADITEVAVVGGAHGVPPGLRNLWASPGHSGGGRGNTLLPILTLPRTFGSGEK